MSIPNIFSKINPYRLWLTIEEKVRFELLIGLIVILTAIGSFGLGRLSATLGKDEPVLIQYNGVATGTPIKTSSQKPIGSQSAAVSNAFSDMTVVASKKGSKYYFTWCSGAKSLSEKNKISFATPEEAEKAGYTKASGCK
jgi:hypothetical protein